MLHKIDWISFTVDVGAGEGRRSDMMPGLITAALEDLSAGLTGLLGLERDVKPTSGRKPYSASWEVVGDHVRVFANPTLPHALVEVSGQGCGLLEDRGTLMMVLSAAMNRLTRLDLATDMLCNTKPTEFVARRTGGRFKSSGFITSPSGETCYVGSRSSDRYARVYRYNPPHERSMFLRAEVQLKGMNARLTAQRILSEGVPFAACSLGDAFGWEHPAWDRSAGYVEALKVWRPERHQGKTEYWLQTQVRPALVKAYAGRPADLLTWVAAINDEIIANSQRQ